MGDTLCLWLAEAPVEQSGYFQLERGRHIGHCLREGPWQDLIESGSVSRPTHLQEFVYYGRCGHLPIPLLTPQQRIPIGLGGGPDHQRRLQQGQRVNHVRVSQRELKGDTATVGMPYDVSTFYAEMKQ